MSSNKYVSEEASKTYSIWVGVLGVVFFLGQFVLPFFGMAFVMPFMTSMTFSRINVENSTYHNGAIWYTKTQMSPRKNEDTSSSTEIYSLQLDREDHAPRKMTELDVEHPWLLSAGNKLWLIANDSVSRWSDAKFRSRVQTRLSGSIKQVFSIRDEPAVHINLPGKRIVSVFRDGGWKKMGQIRERDSTDTVRLLHTQDTFHLFLEEDGTVYHRTGLAESIQQIDDWEPVISDSFQWTVTEKGGRPFVLAEKNVEGFQSDFAGLELKDNRWKQTVSFSQQVMGDFTVFSGAETNRVYVLSEGFPGSAKLITIEAGTITRKTVIGGGFFGGFPPFMMVSMMIIYGFMILSPLALAVIISILMSKYRVTEYDHDRDTRRFAPLWRRAFAQLIDLLIVVGPHIIGAGYMFGEMFSGSFPVTEPWIFVTMFGGLAWSVLMSLLFSFLEGMYGQTPGKWLFGIEVIGEDLEYCGFWRGLLRNLLKLADGFFNFMVGILLVALTEHWQRVGDLVASTIVVQAGERPDEHDSEDGAQYLDQTGRLEDKKS